MLDADSLKLDAILSAVRANGRQTDDVHQAVSSMLSGLEKLLSMFDTQRELLAQILDAVTAEPEEGEDLGELMREIIAKLDALFEQNKALPDTLMESVVIANGGAIDLKKAC
jgi:hypothetical protein